MKIGQYLVNNEYITEEDLLKALIAQKREKNTLLGEIIVRMGKISKEDLEKYIDDYIKNYKNTIINETSRWLGQDEVDILKMQFFNSEIM